MRAYLQLFFGLIVPLSGLFIVASVLYFKIEYDFTKAMRLGVLYGFFIAIAVSLFTALALSILRIIKRPEKDIFSGVKKRKARDTQKAHSKQTIETNKTESNEPTVSINTAKSPITAQENMMLLMDKTIAFEVLLYAISDQKLGQLTESKESQGYVVLKTDKAFIKISISPLTKHTAQIQIHSEIDDMENIGKIMTYMKEKEYAFTQY